jgi:mannose-6-phosphate isomerase
MEGAAVTAYVQSEFFSVYKWDVNGMASFPDHEKYRLASVINGSAALVHKGQTYSIKKGDHFILPANFGEFQLEGNCELIISHT